jgi:hypothetical protein
MPDYHDLEVSLLGIEPRIWRRFLLAQDATFEDLHKAIQDSFGWLEEHLYEFRDKGGRNTIARIDFEDDFELEEAPATDVVALASFFKEKGTRCIYVYDFGDDWHHAVEFKGIVEPPERFWRRLLDGARACPPEDCGGTPGYEECGWVAAMSGDDIKKIRNREEASELKERKEWLGDWHPERFNLAAVKKKFDE